MSSRGNQPAAAHTKSAGFTIIEVLIVLAIAGMMLLIVFEAIPALQRSSRNNQRRQDVQAILVAISRWELNHSGNVPKSTDNYLQYTNLTYYDKTNPSAIQITESDPYTATGYTASTYAAPTNGDTVLIYNHAKCDDTADPIDATNNAAGYNDVVALYAVEAGSGFTAQCQNLT